MLECHGTSATHTLADLQNSLNGLRSGGAPVSVWRDDDLRDAVFISLRSGCCPAALMSLHEITRHMGGAVGVASDGVLLFGVLPALVEAYISRSGVLSWSRHVAPPVRLLASAVLSGPSNDMSFRLASPAAGHELLWLVATRGQLSNACVERAVFELTGHPTCATTVEALHPELGTYQPMAMLRGEPAATMALQNLTAGPGLCIGGATCRVFPITHIRQDAHRAPGGDMAAARLREAAALPGVADAARTTTFSVVAQRSQADEVGRSIGPPSAGTMDLARGQRVLGTSDLCVTTVHVFLRSELTVCTWTVEDPCPGACPPSLDVTTLDSERALLATRSPLASFPREVPSRAGLTEWNGQLLPGEYILAEVAAGGVIDLSGPGELISIRLTQPAWVRILHPLDAGRRAVEAGCSEALTVKLQQITYNTREARIAGQQLPVRAQPPVNGAEAPAPSVARPRGLLGWLASAAVLPPRPDTVRYANGGVDAVAVVRGFVGSWQDLLPAPFVEEAAAWLQEHVEEITRRGGTRHWQWGLAVLTWMMERCGVVELLRDQPTIAGELLAEARFTAAARRQAPFTAWERGQEHCSPGCRLPGGEVASAVTATRLGRTCLQAEVGTEEAIRRLLLDAARRVGPPAGDDVVMGGDNGGPLGDPPDNRIPAPEACRGEEAAAAHDRGAQGPSLDAPTTPGDGPRTAVLGTGGAVDPRLAAEPPLPPPLPPPAPLWRRRMRGRRRPWVSRWRSRWARPLLLGRAAPRHLQPGPAPVCILCPGRGRHIL